MPFKKSARPTVTNEGYLLAALPADAVYFHAQYRQAAANVATTGEARKLNPDGKLNYVYGETRGRGHLMGATLGVQCNADNRMGEGDHMIFIDDEAKPAIIGTGIEDYLLAPRTYRRTLLLLPLARRQTEGGHGADLVFRVGNPFNNSSRERSCFRAPTVRESVSDFFEELAFPRLQRRQKELRKLMVFQRQQVPLLLRRTSQCAGQRQQVRRVRFAPRTGIPGHSLSRNPNRKRPDKPRKRL